MATPASLNRTTHQITAAKDATTKKTLLNAYIAFLFLKSQEKPIPPATNPYTTNQVDWTSLAKTSNALTFASPTDAKDFFNKQAQDGMEFISFEVAGPGGKPTGEMVFSDGKDKKLYTVSNKEIAVFLHQNIGAFKTEALRASLYDELKKTGPGKPNLDTLKDLLKPTSSLDGGQPSMSPVTSNPLKDSTPLLTDTDPTLLLEDGHPGVK